MEDEDRNDAMERVTKRVFDEIINAGKENGLHPGDAGLCAFLAACSFTFEAAPTAPLGMIVEGTQDLVASICENMADEKRAERRLSHAQ